MNEGSANGVPVRIKQRAIALRLNAHGWNVPKIAEYLEWAQQTVRETIQRWQQGGLGGLWDWVDAVKNLSGKKLIGSLYSSAFASSCT